MEDEFSGDLVEKIESQLLMRQYEGPSDLMAVFTRPATPSELTPADFHYVGDDQKVLTAMLKNAVANKEPGVNVLLYGPPGTGKTELAKVAAQAVGLELYEVEYADRDGNSLSGRDRYRSLQISQVFLASEKQLRPNRNGNLYPQHGLGPVAQMMDLNYGDQMDYMVSISSNDFTMAPKMKASEMPATMMAIRGVAWGTQP